MATRKVCDRCGCVINVSNDMVRDLIDSQTPGTDLCESCFLLAEFAGHMAISDIKNNVARGTTLRKMKEMYEDDGNT